MATATFELAPPSGYTAQADGTGQKLLPSGLTYDGTTYSGADGEYDVYNVSDTGMWTYEAVTIGEVIVAPTGTPVFGTPVLGETTAEIPVTYAESDADSLEYSLNSGAWVTFTSPISLTDLDAGTEYTLAARARNTEGTGPEATTTFTTEAAAAPEVATTTFALAPPAGFAVVVMDGGYDEYVFQGWVEKPIAGVTQIVYATAQNTTLASDGELQTDSTTSIEVYAISGTGMWAYAPITNLGELTEAEEPEEPALDAPVLATPIPDQSAVEGEAFSLDLATYLTGDEITYSVTGLPTGTGLTLTGSVLAGTPTSADATASPLSLTATATNSAGSASDTFGVTVEAAAVALPPQDVVIFGTPTATDSSWSVSYTYPGDDATGFEHNINGAGWVSSTSPITDNAADPETAYTVQVRAVNAEGAGPEASITVTTEATAVEPDPDPASGIVERHYTVTATKSNMPVRQQIGLYQGDRVRLTVTPDFDLTGKGLRFKLSPRTNSPAKLIVPVVDGVAVIQSGQTEMLATAVKTWQLVLSEGQDKLVVAEGTCDVRPRIREQE